MTDKSDIFKKCKDAQSNAYNPYSNYAVGCVIVDDQGHEYTGCNVEVAHHKSICAEGTAISQMVLNGGRKIKTVYLIGSGDDLCMPCGDCRQRIMEFALSETLVHSFDQNGNIMETHNIRDLLPLAFSGQTFEK